MSFPRLIVMVTWSMIRRSEEATLDSRFSWVWLRVKRVYPCLPEYHWTLLLQSVVTGPDSNSKAILLHCSALDRILRRFALHWHTSWRTRSCLEPCSRLPAKAGDDVPSSLCQRGQKFRNSKGLIFGFHPMCSCRVDMVLCPVATSRDWLRATHSLLPKIASHSCSK